MKKIALNVSGKTVYKQIRFSKQREFRNKAILNRTRSELDAQEIIEKYFILNKDFSIEFWFQFRRFDFFFPLIRTVIEIDGGYHETVSQKEYDEATDDYLKQKHGLQIIRIKNENVKDYLDKVCQDLLKKYLIKQSNIVLDKKHKIRHKRKLDKKDKKNYNNIYYKVLSDHKKEIKPSTVSVKKTILRKNPKTEVIHIFEAVCPNEYCNAKHGPFEKKIKNLEIKCDSCGNPFIATFEKFSFTL